MSDKIPDLGPKIPIIQKHEDQRLVIDFIKTDDGQDSITFTFEPDFEKVETPSQAAATHIANFIIEQFGLNREGDQNASSTKTEQ